MSEDPPKPHSDKPPRINLPKEKGNGEPDSEPESPENIPVSPENSPSGSITRPKDETFKITLSSAEPPAPPNPSETDQTIKIRLSDAQNPDQAGMAVPAGSGGIKSGSGAFDPFDSNETMRIKLPEGEVEPSSSETFSIPLPSPANTGNEDLSQTVRVDLGNIGDAGGQGSVKKPSSISPSGQTMQVKLPDTGTPSTPGGGSAPEKSALFEETKEIDLHDQTMKVKLQPTVNLGPSITEEDAPKEPTGGIPQVDPSMQTMQIDLSAPEKTPGQATPITPADASIQTMRIEIPEGIPSKKKSETSRLSLGATQSIKEATSELKEQDAKSKSGTIRLGEEGELPALIESQDSLSQQTMQIDLGSTKVEQTSPSSTTPMSPDPAVPDTSSSVDLGEVMQSEPAKAAKADPPKTVRIRKPDAPTPTRVLKRPSEPGQTIRVKGADTVAEDASTGTARIDVSGGGAPGSGDEGDKKTIRIRRPSGATGVAPVIPVSRSGGPKVKPQQQPAPSVGWGYTVAAVITAILIGVTIYVLAAQLNSIPTDGESWPWPGQISISTQS